MKKFFLAVVMMLSVLLLSGCGRETLVCDKSENQMGMTMNEHAEAVFVNNKVTDLNIEIDVKLEKAYVAYIDTFKSRLETAYKKFTDNGGTVKVTTKDDTINISIHMYVDKMTKDQLKNLDMEDVYGTKSATKKSLESSGYTCK